MSPISVYFRNPRYKDGSSFRPRSSTLSSAGPLNKPQARPRRTMSVSTKEGRPTPRPRLSSQLDRLSETESPESVYSMPWSEPAPAARRRVSSVSSSSSSLSSSCSSAPSSPVSLSPEQFWAKYKRNSEGKKFRNLFSSLTLSEPEPAAVAEVEPLYAEIYGVGARQPPLPRKNSVSKPPARPPYPASSVLK